MFCVCIVAEPAGGSKMEILDKVPDQRGFIEFPLECIERRTSTPVDHVLIIRSPTHDYIVWSHPVCHIVAGDRSRVSDPFGDASFGRHDIYFCVSVISSEERRVGTGVIIW